MSKVTITVSVDADLVQWATVHGVDAQDVFERELVRRLVAAEAGDTSELQGIDVSTIAEAALLKAKAEAVTT